MITQKTSTQLLSMHKGTIEICNTPFYSHQNFMTFVPILLRRELRFRTVRQLASETCPKKQGSWRLDSVLFTSHTCDFHPWFLLPLSGFFLVPGGPRQLGQWGDQSGWSAVWDYLTNTMLELCSAPRVMTKETEPLYPFSDSGAVRNHQRVYMRIQVFKLGPALLFENLISKCGWGLRIHI